ncbi:hypothetical protein CCACVL1_07291 [Corchorus capsularis]|uniref:Uncharacterized protein n=1 Tax=Corchorus capsularis TaxID=210143 RepID=A0A1R3J7P6_COCAP|nr:hypothetical protein CCACVL1_07291 [Corchorus capsularis]
MGEPWDSRWGSNDCGPRKKVANNEDHILG